MANVALIKTGIEIWIQPGQTYHGKWNQATPREGVWSAQAIPFSTGDSTQGFNEDVSLEVTRVWRRLIVIEKKPYPQSQTFDVVIEDEIHFEIKNIGNEKSRCAVYLSVIY